MAGWEDELLRVAGEIEDAREELERLYEERAELVADAVSQKASQAEIGRVLGVSHTAVQKIMGPIWDRGVAATLATLDRGPPLTDTSP